MREPSLIHRRLFSIIALSSVAPRVIRRVGLGQAILLFFLLLPSITIQAQNNTAATWRLFQNESGLASNDVWTVLAQQDAVWIATSEGLARYDGAWTTFPYMWWDSSDAPTQADLADDSTGWEHSFALEEGVVVTMAAGSSAGTIWAGSTSGEVLFWDGTEWHRSFTLPALLYRLTDYDGRVYAATDRGLYVFDPSQMSYSQVPALAETSVVALYSAENLWVGSEKGVHMLNGNGDWIHLRLPERFGVEAVTALVTDDREHLWVGTPLGVGWFHLPTSTWSESLIPLPNERNQPTPVFALAQDRAGAIWAASNGGGARKLIDLGFIEVDVARASGGGLTTPLVRDISLGADGSVWFATPVGLFQYQEERWYSDYVDRNGAATRLNNINELLVAQDGTLWIATGGAGIRRKVQSVGGYQETVFNLRKENLPHDGVLALAEDREAAIWAGTFSGVVRFHGNNWTTPVDMSSLPSPVVTELLASEDGMWIGTEAGLAHYMLDTGALEVESVVRGKSVEAMAFDGAGRLWVGTADAGVMLLDQDGTWSRLHKNSGLPSALPGVGIQTGGLARDPITPNGMWAIVTGVGLVHFDGETWQITTNAEHVPSSLLYRLFTDPIDGSLWVGGEGGVSHYDGVTWGTFTTQSGLQSSAIYAIAYAPGGNYWFGGAEGLTRYRPDRDPPWVRIEKMERVETNEAGQLVVRQGYPAGLQLLSGDLQTSVEDLELYYRIKGTSNWIEVEDAFVPLTFDEVGPAAIELMARDQAFNYSDILEQVVTVAPPVEYIILPLLGSVERSIFYTLLFLATTAVLGFGYVSLEIVQTHLRAIDALNRGFNPYVSGEPVRREDMFFGRHDLLQRIVDTLHNNSIMIHGERRIGKTTLLYQLANTLREVEDPEFRFLPIYIDLEGTTQEVFFHYLMEEIAVGVLEVSDLGPRVEETVAALRYHDIDAEEYTDRMFAQDLRQLVLALQNEITALSSERRLRLILLLDEVDVLSRYDQLVQQQLRRIFMRDFAATLGAVVSGIQISKDWDRVESPWFNLFNEIALQPFDRRQALELLIEPVRDVYRYEPAALEFIIERSDGRPYRIQQYALLSVNYMLARRHRRIMLDDAIAAQQDIETVQSVTATGDHIFSADASSRRQTTMPEISS